MLYKNKSILLKFAILTLPLY